MCCTISQGQVWECCWPNAARSQGCTDGNVACLLRLGEAAKTLLSFTVKLRVDNKWSYVWICIWMNRPFLHQNVPSVLLVQVPVILTVGKFGSGSGVFKDTDLGNIGSSSFAKTGASPCFYIRIYAFTYLSVDLYYSNYIKNYYNSIRRYTTQLKICKMSE